jgi:hypothetical protein
MRKGAALGWHGEREPKKGINYTGEWWKARLMELASPCRSNPNARCTLLAQY